MAKTNKIKVTFKMHAGPKHNAGDADDLMNGFYEFMKFMGIVQTLKGAIEIIPPKEDFLKDGKTYRQYAFNVSLPASYSIQNLEDMIYNMIKNEYGTDVENGFYDEQMKRWKLESIK